MQILRKNHKEMLAITNCHSGYECVKKAYEPDGRPDKFKDTSTETFPLKCKY